MNKKTGIEMGPRRRFLRRQFMASGATLAATATTSKMAGRRGKPAG
ncbi:MAG: hypothetical protein ACODAD_12285 [Planctomycetota bacterium]